MAAAAATSLAATQRILTQGLSGVSEAGMSQLPAVEAMRRSIRRQRRRAAQPLPGPRNREDVDLPERYRKTADDQQFLQVDTGGADRLLIFATNDGLDLLQNSTHWLCDGTFKSAPTIFFQLYTFHAIVQDRVVACLYALLPNKREETYHQLLERILELRPNMRPESVMTDFECAMKNAVNAAFDGVQVSHCHFHLCQNVFRHVQGKGLQQAYVNDETLSLHVRMLMALPFLPPDDVIDGFVELADDCSDELEPVVEYFESTYIGKRHRNGRWRHPLFPIPSWNVHNRAELGLPRTNNPSEGSHSRLAANLACQHPDLFKLIEALVREASLSRLNVTHALIGHQPPPKRKKYNNKEKRIETLLEKYDTTNKLTFLRGIALNIVFYEDNKLSYIF